MKRILLLALFLVSTLISYAQGSSVLMTPVSLQARANEATLIIEGEVVNSISYWDVAHKNIYTIHEVTVYKNAKGVNITTVFVETDGGQVDNQIHDVSSAARLEKGDEGVFFLKPSNHSFNIPQTTYKMVAAAQGYIKYDRIDKNASDVFNKYTSIENDLYAKLEQATNKTLTVVQQKQVINTSNLLLAIPVISNVSPTTITAGTQSVLTINGSNFGTAIGEVSFKYANTGGLSYRDAKTSEIVSWSNTQIQVEVPFGAGSGIIRVTNADNEAGVSSTSITIPYNHYNFRGPIGVFPTKLQNDNGNGGFSFEYHTDFNTSAAKPFFEEAFGVWNCQTGINFQLGTAITTIDERALDGVNVVRFDNGPELATGVLGIVYLYGITCDDDGNGYIREMDFVWDDDTNWYFGNGTPGATQYDFKSIALHELGNAHQLGAVINVSSVMHYDLSPGQENYNLNSDDIDGANYTMDFFIEPTPNCSDFSPMMPDIQCDYVYVPDDNFEQRLIDLGYDSGPLDDYVPTASIYGVTFLNVSNQNITDLTGIKGFTALETLFCDDNNLTTINTSFNTALTNLRCFNNQISSLDLSLNTNLKYLSASPNNLTTLDLQFNTALIEAFLNNNDLIALNVDACVALERLQVKGNNLNALSIANGNNINITEFNAENNPNLSCINVDDATASYLSSPLWLKDVTASYSEHCNDTYVPDNNFEAYLEANGMGNGVANDNYVTTANINTVTLLDVAGEGIADLTGIEDFIALTGLNCRSNTLTNLDITNNTQLTILHCDSNTLTNLDITNNTQLATLNCFDNALTSLDVTQNTLLVTLRTGNNNVTSIDVTQNSLLKIFSCYENAFTSLDVTQNLVLEDLDCIRNNLTTLDVSNNNQLINLDCYENNLTSLNITQNPLLEELFCSENQLTSLDLSQNTVLNELEAEFNNLYTLNVANGNNMNIANFDIGDNPNLTCVFVDDAEYSTTYWPNKDTHTSYNDVKCYTYVPDDNFENYLETHDISGNTVAIGDTNSMGNGIIDDYVNTAIINTVISLNVSNNNIADLTGIEDFIVLETLNCFQNSLIELDLNANTALKTVSSYLNQLTLLDVSGAINLEMLDVSNNSLTTLNLDSNNVLQSLIVDGNSIVALDLSNNSALTYISAFENNLTTLNIQNGNNNNVTVFSSGSNPDLTCINVDNANAATAGTGNYNSWVKDDSASYSEHCYDTYVPDDNFENYLETHDALGNTVNVGDVTSMGNGISNDDYVTTANIEHVISLQIVDKNIESLIGIEGFLALDNLNFSNNQVVIVDLTNNVNLKWLSFNNNLMTSIDLSENTALTAIIANDNLLESIDFSTNIVLGAIEVQNNQLTSLNVKNGNNMSIAYFDATNNPNLSCILVDNAAYSTTEWGNIDGIASFNAISCDYVAVEIDVLLQGAMLNNGGSNIMRDDLRAGDNIPTSSPYNLDSIDTSILTITGANAIVDWVYVELRDANDNTFIVANTSALLQRDGDVVSLDGVSPVNINAPSGDYYVSIKHRNHLGIMTANTIALSSTATTIDFTDANNPITFGTDAQTTFGMPSGVVAMWAGDTNGDGQLNYLGTTSEIPFVRSQVFNDPDNSVFGGPPIGTYQSPGYNTTDIDMNGFSIFSGANSDILYVRDNIFNNPSNSVFGGPPVATYIFIQQLP